MVTLIIGVSVQFSSGQVPDLIGRSGELESVQVNLTCRPGPEIVDKIVMSNLIHSKYPGQLVH